MSVLFLILTVSPLYQKATYHTFPVYQKLEFPMYQIFNLARTISLKFKKLARNKSHLLNNNQLTI